VKVENKRILDSMKKKEVIFHYIKEEGPISRNELVRLTGFPRTTIYDNLKAIGLGNGIRKVISRNGKKGRPKVYYYHSEDNPCKKCAWRDCRDEFHQANCIDCVPNNLKYFCHKDEVR